MNNNGKFIDKAIELVLLKAKVSLGNKIYIQLLSKHLNPLDRRDLFNIWFASNKHSTILSILKDYTSKEIKKLLKEAKEERTSIPEEQLIKAFEESITFDDSKSIKNDTYNTKQ